MFTVGRISDVAWAKISETEKSETIEADEGRLTARTRMTG